MSVLLKQLQDSLPNKVETALAEHVRVAENWATKIRLWLALTSLVAAYWMWDHHSNAKIIYLAFAALWLVTMFVASALTKRNASLSLATKTTFFDLTIVHLGLVAFVFNGLFPKIGAGIFLCYFPILAVAATRYRIMLVVQASAYALIGYAAISFWAGSPPWFRLSLLAATAFVFALGSHKPKDLMVSVAKNALQEAFDLGSKQREFEMTEQVHQLFMPAPLMEMPEVWASSKHGAGTETGGDYYQIFDTAKGPLIVLGDLSIATGKKFDSLAATNELHKTLTKIANRNSAESNLTAIMDELNSELCRKSRPFTCVLAQWRGDQLHYVNAGHLPLVHLNKPQGATTAGRKQLPVTCGAVGEKADAKFVESAVPFPARDLLLMYTDGAFAKLTGDRDKGIVEIEEMAERFSGGEVTTLCHRVFDCGQPGFEQIKDDATVVVVRRQPVAANS
ncbi:MAG: PP2C family protein-serine/threonine phosphatase [Acidobacteriota bacterium]|nr:PP2C family protein-serine/threonine phosphatase [Acidobacteriota bacterium]